MAFIIKDRVKETTTSTGTGAVSLGGADDTFEQFQTYMSNGDTTYYAIVHKGPQVDEWEVGLGTWNTGNTLTRTTIISSSNSNNVVNLSAGDKNVFITSPASKSNILDDNGDANIEGKIHIGEYIDFDAQSTHPAHREGRLWYDNIHKTLNYHSDDNSIIHELGLEEHMRVYNNSGATISKGKPVYFTGAYTAGTQDVPTIGLANATDMVKFKAMGVVASDISNNSYGYIIVTGILTGVDTSHLTVGENFFVGITDGATQTLPPVYPNFPMCLGFVVQVSATEGIVLLAQQNHSIKSFRVISDTHIGGDLTIDGNLNVLGTTSTTSTSDVTAGAPFYRANEGDAIGEAGTDASGVTGLDDAFFAGHFTGTTPTTYYVKIDSVGTPDTFAVSTDNFATTISTGNAITGSEQMIHSADNISVTFGATTGHTLNDLWTGTASPNLVDTGFWSNRNTGTTGVGYTHMGLWYDVSDSVWNLTDEYDPTPSGTINKADSSYVKGTLVADITGDVTGDLTGNVTGNTSGTHTGNVLLGTSDTIIFEGATDDSFETTLTVDDATADRTITLPDATGTVVIQNSTTGATTIAGSDPSLVIDNTAFNRSEVKIHPYGGYDRYAIEVDASNTALTSALFLRVDNSTMLAMDNAVGVSFYQDARFTSTSDIIFVGTNNTTLTRTDAATADRTITLPDADGTVVLKDSSSVIDMGTGSLSFDYGTGTISLAAPVNALNSNSYSVTLPPISGGLASTTGSGISGQIFSGMHQFSGTLFVTGDIVVDDGQYIKFASNPNAFGGPAIQADTSNNILKFFSATGSSAGHVFSLAGNNLIINSSNYLAFEGATDDAFETRLTVVDPTADRLITIPDQDGQLLMFDANDDFKLDVIDSLSSTTTGNKIVFGNDRGQIYYWNDQTSTNNDRLHLYSDDEIYFETSSSGTQLEINGYGNEVWSTNGFAADDSGEGFRIKSNKKAPSPFSPDLIASLTASGLYLGSTTDGVVFEGATEDNFETTLTATDPTADRTITLPDESGTVALEANVASTGKAIAMAIVFG